MPILIVLFIYTFFDTESGNSTIEFPSTTSPKENKSQFFKEQKKKSSICTLT